MPAASRVRPDATPFATQERRNARLLYGVDPAGGDAALAGAHDLARLRDAVRVRPVPPRPVRVWEQVLYKAGRLTGAKALADGALRARLEAGARGEGAHGEGARGEGGGRRGAERGGAG
ncbi:MAG TPA: hypothetical protein VL972_00340, partial [Solirubrobacteraceae bacterium]|nr:hypothetical protein [Solirubrobacteraceae bacterium]